MTRVWDENWFVSTKTLDVTTASPRARLAASRHAALTERAPVTAPSPGSVSPCAASATGSIRRSRRRRGRRASPTRPPLAPRMTPLGPRSAPPSPVPPGERAPRPVRHLVLAAAIVGVLFAALTVAVSRTTPLPVDRVVHEWVLAHRTAPVVTAALAVTSTGSGLPAYLLAALAGVIAYGRRWWVGAPLAVLALLAAQGVRLAIVNAVDRPRPPTADWAAGAGGDSFPSGHTTTSALVAALLCAALTRRLHGRRLRVAQAVVVAPGRPRRADADYLACTGPQTSSAAGCSRPCWCWSRRRSRGSPHLACPPPGSPLTDQHTWAPGSPTRCPDMSCPCRGVSGRLQMSPRVSAGFHLGRFPDPDDGQGTEEDRTRGSAVRQVPALATAGRRQPLHNVLDDARVDEEILTDELWARLEPLIPLHPRRSDNPAGVTRTTGPHSPDPQPAPRGGDAGRRHSPCRRGA